MRCDTISLQRLHFPPRSNQRYTVDLHSGAEPILGGRAKTTKMIFAVKAHRKPGEKRLRMQSVFIVGNSKRFGSFGVCDLISARTTMDGNLFIQTETGAQNGCRVSTIKVLRAPFELPELQRGNDLLIDWRSAIDGGTWHSEPVPEAHSSTNSAIIIY